MSCGVHYVHRCHYNISMFCNIRIVRCRKRRSINKCKRVQQKSQTNAAKHTSNGYNISFNHHFGNMDIIYTYGLSLVINETGLGTVVLCRDIRPTPRNGLSVRQGTKVKIFLTYSIASVITTEEEQCVVSSLSFGAPK